MCLKMVPPLFPALLPALSGWERGSEGKIESTTDEGRTGEDKRGNVGINRALSAALPLTMKSRTILYDCVLSVLFGALERAMHAKLCHCLRQLPCM